MKLLFLVNDAAGVSAQQSTAHLAWVAAARGHQVSVAGAGDLSVDQRGVPIAQARPFPPACPNPAAALAALGPVRAVPAGDFGAIWIRTNPARDPRPWVHEVALQWCCIARDLGCAVLNDPDGLRRAANKLYLSELPASVRPVSLVSRSRAEIAAFVAAAPGPCVLKPLLGTQGRDVFRVTADAANLPQIIDVLTRSGFCLAQHFVPEAAEGDVRVLLVDGELLQVDGVPCLVRRVPGPGEFRSNVAQGGSPSAAALTPAITRIIQAVGPRLRQDGLFLVGLDVIGSVIVEANVYSPGGLQDAGAFMGRDFVTAAVAAFERKAHMVSSSSSA